MLIHLCGSPGPAEWLVPGAFPVHAHAFPFSLFTCHFSNSHFHIGVFTSAVIGMNKNSDCWKVHSEHLTLAISFNPGINSSRYCYSLFRDEKIVALKGLRRCAQGHMMRRGELS